CSAPPTVPNGQFTPSSSTFSNGATVTYACNTGFRIFGSSSLTCIGGTWSGPGPSCTVTLFFFLASCPPPPSVPNGQFTPSSRRFVLGATVTYACTAGFQISGSSILTCTSSGTWSGPGPSCTGKDVLTGCPSPPSVPNAQFTPSSTTFAIGATVTYACTAGFQISGSSILTCIGGTWSGPGPSCIGCQAPPALTNGEVFPNNPPFRHGMVVLYTCKPGYTFNGTKTRNCLTTGQWTMPSSPPVCNAAACPAPPTVPNGQFTPSSTTFANGATVTYACTAGFQISGSSSLTCTSSGTWSGPGPSCIVFVHVLAACPPPPSVPNAQFTPSSPPFVIGALVTYACSTGFQISGSSILTCTSSGTWSGPGPSCTASCPPPPSVPNAQFIPSSPPFVIGTLVTYACSTGFQISGSPSLTCTSSGTWSGPGPTSCPPPPSVPNGQFTPFSPPFVIGALVTYACSTGFQISGSSVLTCTSSGTWSGPGPSCTGRDVLTGCPPPPSVPNGQFIPSSPPFVIGALVTYACSTGFQISGSSILTCTSSGTWSGPGPSCTASCPPPPSVPNGQFIPSSPPFVIGALVTYACSTGFQISGSSVLTCTSSGTWSGPGPSCTAGCPSPPSVSNGQFTPSSTTFSIGATVTYACSAGFQISGSSILTCTSSGTWSGPGPSCIAPPALTNGEVFPNNPPFRHGMVVLYTCKPGYTLNGTKTRNCLTTGQWTMSSYPPVCNAAGCPPPPSVPNGQFTPSSTTFSIGATVTYACSAGFQISGSSSLTCTSSGTWSGPGPSCTAACPPPPSVPNGLVTPSSGTFFNGDSVTYACYTIYLLSGSPILTCIGGTWSGPGPSCTGRQSDTVFFLASCPPPPSVPNGQFTPSSRRFVLGAMVTYACTAGFQISGSSILTCTSSGTWSGPEPSCTDVCSAPPTVPNAQFTPFSTTFANGATVTYACNTGFQISGSSSLTCIGSGTWSGPGPSCTGRDV
uniref:Sushi domain-containing protein n=1 Tax=Ciona savignyi TaxID=51511 RepID=H2Y8B7_CIOSA